MSELINTHDNRATIRWKLLTGVSALVLTASVSSLSVARAEDASQPQIWIELGGQLSRLEDGRKAFSPQLMDSRPSIFVPSQKFEKPPLYGFDETGVISFEPQHSSWLFSASIRYGRSSANRHVLQHTTPEPFVTRFATGYTRHAYPIAEKFADTKARNSGHHLILDFEAGKDVGLGLFGGKDVMSVISTGVRFAQFGSKTNISLKSDPDWHFNYIYSGFIAHASITNGQPFHSNLANMSAEREFRGVGPLISWKASAPIAGNIQDGALTLDWGLSAAALFGRQKTHTHQQSTARYHRSVGHLFAKTAVAKTTARYTTPDQTRSRNITVPNVGGSIGLSWRLQDFKMSIGYKADFFFGAIDGGIDTRKNENRAFFGPYASISIGLGD